MLRMWHAHNHTNPNEPSIAEVLRMRRAKREEQEKAAADGRVQSVRNMGNPVKWEFDVKRTLSASWWDEYGTKNCGRNRAHPASRDKAPCGEDFSAAPAVNTRYR
jgi:hypothetical protein